MDWLKILSAGFMIGMLFFIYPRMKHAMQNSPKGSNKDWMGFVIPLSAVIGFVVFLVMMVRN